MTTRNVLVSTIQMHLVLLGVRTIMHYMNLQTHSPYTNAKKVSLLLKVVSDGNSSERMWNDKRPKQTQGNMVVE